MCADSDCDGVHNPLAAKLAAFGLMTVSVQLWNAFHNCPMLGCPDIEKMIRKRETIICDSAYLQRLMLACE
jgi:hypothetical protein